MSEQCTVGQNNQEYRLKYWATHSSVYLFTSTAHSFACSALLALLARSAVLTRSLTSLTDVNDWMTMLSVFFSVLDHSATIL